MWMSFVVASAIAYLLGSIPFGLILVRTFRGMDVRQTGSGNIGSANVARLSRGLGVWTLILDSAKGYVAVIIARAIANHSAAGTGALHYVGIVVGASALFAVLGHMFSIFLKFKGGKGVATAMGAFLAILPLAVLIAALLYVAIYAFSHYTSLASITSAALFPVIAGILMTPAERQVVLPFIAAVCLIIVVKHHQNIRRLLSGTENRLELKRP